MMTKCPRDYETAINKHIQLKLKTPTFTKFPVGQWQKMRSTTQTSCTEGHELVPWPYPLRLQVQCQELKTTLFNLPDENLLQNSCQTIRGKSQMMSLRTTFS